MRYCSNCGQKVANGAKFCSNCGIPIGISFQDTHSQRKLTYDGVIHKCPNCGEILNAFTSKCPACGYELRGTTAANSVKELYRNIQKAKSESEVVRLIKTFPVPNNKEDILEFMILASSNFNEEAYIEHMSEENISAAWFSKIEQCYKKANLSLSSEDMLEFNEIYSAITERIALAKKKTSQKRILQQSEVTAREFKKSKFRIVLVTFSVISVLFCVLAFQNSRILAGLVSALMVVLFLTAFLMGSGVINERVKNFRLVPAILAFLLFAPYFSLLSNHRGNFLGYYKNAVERISWEDLNLGKNLPDFGYNKAEVVHDTDDNLILYFYDIDSSKYESYIEKCKEFGYSIDAEDSGANYTAYNQDGYYLHLQYWDFADNKQLTIELDDPIKSEQLVWPSSNLVKDLPLPKSLVGEVSTETSEAYAVYLVQIEPTYFSEYVSLCMDNGFNVDYSKSDTYFRAENDDGISLTVEYRGFNIMYIYIEDYDW